MAYNSMAYDLFCISQFQQRPAPFLGWPSQPLGISVYFLPWMVNSRGWGLLSWQIPQGGDKKRGRMPRPSSTLQHFSLISQSKNAILSISMCDFCFNVFLCNSVRILIKTSRSFTPQRRAPVYGFSIDIKLLTLKLIERCKAICYE